MTIVDKDNNNNNKAVASVPCTKPCVAAVLKMCVVCWCFMPVCCLELTHYRWEAKLYADKLGPSSGYDPHVRPQHDLNLPTVVNVTFDLLSILEIDTVKQQIVVNGMFCLTWIDELLSWTPADYGNALLIHPDVKQIWRPRVILSNTVDKRDLFEDITSPLFVLASGEVEWLPGSLIKASCKMNLYRFPFDRHYCKIEMMAMMMLVELVQFHVDTEKINLTYYLKSGEWELIHASITTNHTLYASFYLNFVIRRRPGFFIVNIVSPIVLLSFLNILVFLIPVDSGEKIGYGITVLLALTVFMSIVSEQLPKSSDTLPLLNVYLLALLVISTCTVIVSIATVNIDKRNKNEMANKRATSNFRGLYEKTTLLNRAVAQFRQGQGQVPTTSSDGGTSTGLEDPESMEANGTKTSPADDVCTRNNVSSGSDVNDNNRWGVIGRHIDTASFVVFLVIWLTVTVGFLLEINQ